MLFDFAPGFKAQNSTTVKDSNKHLFENTQEFGQRRNYWVALFSSLDYNKILRRGAIAENGYCR